MTVRKLFLGFALVAIGFALVAGLGSAALNPTVGPNVNVTKAAGNQAEGTIAVNPTNPNQLFVASNPGATARRSTDGGATWIAAGAGIGASCCDNVAAWDSFGNLFLVNINGAVNAVVLYLSTDGGANFSLLQTIDTGGIDQPSVKAGAGSVWVTWNDGTIEARGAPVTGLGVVGAFIAEEAAPNANTVGGQFGDIAIGPSGQVTVTYQSDTDIYVNTDADGLGAGGFGPQVHVTSTNVAKFDFLPAQSGRSIDAEANLAWDRSGGAHNGRLYLCYTDESPDESNNTDIFVRYSDDNGATWSGAVKVNDDATTRSQILPNISIDQTTGNVATSWHDARNDPANNNTQFWGAVSDTGGASFGANFQISAGTSNDDTAGSGVDYGDYTWGDSYGNVFHPVWADNSNSTGDNPDGANSRFDIYTAAVTINNTPPVLTVPGPQTVDYHDTLTFNVSATDADPGDTLSFTASGLPASLALTDNLDRTATVSGTITDPPGVYNATITVSDGHNPPVSDTVQITVTREQTTTHYTGPFAIAQGFPATLNGQLLEDGVTPIAGRTLTLSLDGQSCVTNLTDASGNASCTIPVVTAPLGPQTVKADFAGDTFYLPSSETSTAIVFAFPAGGGGFVLGDSTVAAAGPSTTLTFWGAQWSTLNALSGSAAVASFKGFAGQTASPPACGGTWSARPGNSSSPPASLPPFMGVLVTSSMSKSGSTISGNIVHIIVVTPDPGYAPNPGHAGTGKLVTTVC